MADEFTEEVLKSIVAQSRSWGGFPEPTTDPAALQKTAAGLKQAVEQLLRRRGDPLDSALLVRDLQAIFAAIEFVIGEAVGDIDQPDPFSGSHNDLSDVEPDQHHNQKHDIFSEDHDITGAEPTLEGDLLEYVPGNSWRIGRRMEYRGNYEIQDYNKGHVVLDGEWTMVALETTDDPAAPVAVGAPGTLLPDVPTWDVPNPILIDVIETGVTMNFISGGYINGIRVWVPSVGGNIVHRIFYINETNPGQPIVQLIPFPFLLPDQWNVVELSARVLPIGSQVRIMIQHVDIASSLNFDGQWRRENYTGGSPPPTGEWKRNGGHTELLFNKLDNTQTDREIELLSVTQGSLIRIETAVNTAEFSLYYVSSVEDFDATTVRYFVSRLDQGSGGPDVNDLCDCFFESIVAAPIAYSENIDYWLTNGQPLPNVVTVQGYRKDGDVLQSVPDNSYGVDCSIQEARISPSWGLVAFNGNTRGSFINEPLLNRSQGGTARTAEIPIIDPGMTDTVIFGNGAANHSFSWLLTIIDIVLGTAGSSEVVASHNGTVATHSEFGITGDTVPYTITVDLLGGAIIRLRITNTGPNPIFAGARRLDI